MQRCIVDNCGGKAVLAVRGERQVLRWFGALQSEVDSGAAPAAGQSDTCTTKRRQRSKDPRRRLERLPVGFHFQLTSCHPHGPSIRCRHIDRAAGFARSVREQSPQSAACCPGNSRPVAHHSLPVTRYSRAFGRSDMQNSCLPECLGHLDVRVVSLIGSGWQPVKSTPPRNVSSKRFCLFQQWDDTSPVLMIGTQPCLRLGESANPKGFVSQWTGCHRGTGAGIADGPRHRRKSGCKGAHDILASLHTAHRC